MAYAKNHRHDLENREITDISSTETPTAGKAAGGWDEQVEELIPDSLKESIRQNPWLWAGGATIAGLLIAKSYNRQKQTGVTVLQTPNNLSQSSPDPVQTSSPLGGLAAKTLEQVQPELIKLAQKQLAKILDHSK